MRNIFLKANLFCLLLLTFSCAKETEYLDAGGQTSSLKVKIDGTLKEFQMATAAIMDLSPKKALQIMASNGTKDGLSIMLGDYTGAKTYNLTENGNIATFTLDAEKPLETTFFAEEGKVIITSASTTTISGTFEFKAKNGANNSEKVFKEGTFVIKIADPTKNPSIPVTPQNTNITAKFDNTDMKFAGEATLISFTQPTVWTVMSIMGYSDKKMLSISIDSYAGTGTFDVNANTNHGITYTTNYSVDANEYIATSGKIIVTQSTTNRIKGTFEATLEKADDASKKISVKNGTFDMEYKKM